MAVEMMETERRRSATRLDAHWQWWHSLPASCHAVFKLHHHISPLSIPISSSTMITQNLMYREIVLNLLRVLSIVQPGYAAQVVVCWLPWKPYPGCHTLKVIFSDGWFKVATRFKSEFSVIADSKLLQDSRVKYHFLSHSMLTAALLKVKYSNKVPLIIKIYFAYQQSTIPEGPSVYKPYTC